MGIFKKIRGATHSKANAMLDRAIDPLQEIEILILDLETQYRLAMKELISYKADVKLGERSVQEQKTRALAWEKRAMIAIKRGEDDTAKACLKRKRDCEQEVLKIKGDMVEAAGYASKLNASRKKLDEKLRMLKLRKGTLAGQLAAARTGTSDPLADDALFDKMEEAERKIDAQVFEQEAAAELDDEAGGTLALEAELLKVSRGNSEMHPDSGNENSGDDPLSALKSKMAHETKQLEE